MIVALLCLFALHPGHMTRLELRVSDDSQCIETAMKISAVDLEAALKRRLGHAARIESLTDDQAEQKIGDYLRSTLLVQDKPLSKEQFNWVGWEKEQTHVWIYFEIRTRNTEAAETQLKIQSLFEVEPELQHIVILEDKSGKRTLILRKSMSDVAIAVPSK